MESILKNRFFRSRKNANPLPSDKNEYYDGLLAEQKARIDELKEELAARDKIIADYKEREESIKEILYVAADTAKELDTDLKIQYALEIERLKIFQAKWTTAYDTLKEKYSFGTDACTMEALATEASLELRKTMKEDFGIKFKSKSSAPEQAFRAEIERLKPNEKELGSLIQELRQSLSSKAENKEEEEAPEIDELMRELI